MRGLILLIIALAISAVVVPIGFVYQLLKTWLKATDRYLFRIAKSIDQTGNAVCEDLFNDALIRKKSVYRFGNEDETISSVLGKNKQKGTLSLPGKWLAYLLDTIEKDHTTKAIGH